MSTAETALTITAPNLLVGEFSIEGTAPYVQQRFSKKQEMLDAQMKLGGTKGKKREARDPDADYKGAMHIGENGKHGIPCAAFRSSMIDACRAAGFQMTKAKMSVFCLPDTIDIHDGSPLVHIKGKPERLDSHVRLESGVASIAIRPMWRKWSAVVRVQFDGDQFTMNDVGNLLARAGMQVGVGEGRPYSKKSHGMGWGTFKLV